MRITIINASPYGNKNSNTEMIVNTFKKAIAETGNEVMVYSLSDRTQWDVALKAAVIGGNIVFVMPVYVGMTPSVFKEFVEHLDGLLTDEARKKLNISFILQSAFPENAQRECCEKYLKSLTEHLKCNFSGILSHSVFYSLIDKGSFDSLVEAYSYFGKRYVENKFTFFFPEVGDFNGPEFLTEKQAQKFVRGFNLMCRFIADEKA